ncbi:GNAT family N-acetyltransferase [Desmospora activa]|uniref:RimJ/RimL family protein N-acetyltransferase n=1 Tax=Desmospora activa DSM 45169 TaxID=1121389 RepID=A0A2T4ZAA2_9BACL|nr:GNAT family protein [Desmospora activa]PTM58820.1 RimJ/RimL family protein N-acetyltransferase [Desmospora activa DSM 45169]
MKGHMVQIAPLEEEDFKLMSQWLRPSAASALGSGKQDFFRADQLKEEITNDSTTNYVTILTHDGEKIGFVSWKKLQYEGSYELGGIVGDHKLWDSGCGAEASVLVMDHLFQYKNAHRIQFITGLFNKRTMNMLMKNKKVVMEGILRDYNFVDGQYYDAVVWSVLRDEYYAIDEFGQPTTMIPEQEKKQIEEEFHKFLQENWNSQIYNRLVQARR